MNWQTWLKGLISAIIGGAANTVIAAGIAPETFNFGEGFEKLLMMMAGGAFIAAANYLKQSPVPKASIQGALKSFIILAVCSTALFGMVNLQGCQVMQGKTATEQISAQTSNPVALADALYYDQLVFYEELLRTYRRYKLFLLREPYGAKKVEAIETTLRDMKRTLDDWYRLRGAARILAIEDGTGELMDKRREAIYFLATYMSEGR